MKIRPSKTKADPQPITAVQRGQAAAKAMAKELRAEHKRWNLPCSLGRTAKSSPRNPDISILPLPFKNPKLVPAKRSVDGFSIVIPILFPITLNK